MPLRESSRPSGRSTAAVVAVYGFRLLVLAHAMHVLVQPGLMGRFMDDKAQMLAAHRTVGLSIMWTGSLVILGAVLTWWLARWPWWLPFMGLSMLAVEGTQITTAERRDLGVHVPVGVLLVAVMLRLVGWAWQQPIGTRRGRRRDVLSGSTRENLADAEARHCAVGGGNTPTRRRRIGRPPPSSRPGSCSTKPPQFMPPVGKGAGETTTGPERLASSARGLVKRYGSIVALDGPDLDARRGSVLALLGSNGAGTLARARRGARHRRRVDVPTDAEAVRTRLGLSGQNAAFDECLTGFKSLVMAGRLYGSREAHARRRANELLERFCLTATADRPLLTYSVGMRRRLDLSVRRLGHMSR